MHLKTILLTISAAIIASAPSNHLQKKFSGEEQQSGITGLGSLRASQMVCGQYTQNELQEHRITIANGISHYKEISNESHEHVVSMRDNSTWLKKGVVFFKATRDAILDLIPENHIDLKGPEIDSLRGVYECMEQLLEMLDMSHTKVEDLRMRLVNFKENDLENMKSSARSFETKVKHSGLVS